MSEQKKLFQPTAKQLALAEARRLKKMAQKEKAKQEVEEKSKILPREWLSIQPPGAGSVSVKVMTWNLLAQCLEVDRTEKLFPVLRSAGYAFVYATGPRKKHGCLIAFKKDAFSVAGEKSVLYDDQEARSASGDDVDARGGSFRTKNICSLVALQRTNKPHDGVIVATTHLFWHPSYTYERTRQTAILFREVINFRRELGKEHWQCIIAGDFNFQPDDATYSLLIGDNLLPNQSKRLASSRVVHVTVDPSVPITTNKMLADEEEGASEADPDRAITNARTAVEKDGLLTDTELESMFRSIGSVFSAYDRGLRSVECIRELTFGSREDVPLGRAGAHEPLWTSYTYYWKTVLDYIFVLEAQDRPVTVNGLAKPIPTADLEPGLPRKGVCESDHISLCAELSWPE